MSLERATLELLESLHTKYVCMTCGNRGHEGKHEANCQFFAVLKAWRVRGAGRGRGAEMKVICEFPVLLLERADLLAEAISISRSELIRRAVRDFCDGLDKQVMQAQLAEGYRAHSGKGG